MTSQTRKRLLVVGGGFAGTVLAVQCSSSMDVTLVDKKSFFEINLASPRALVDAQTAERISIPYSTVPKAGTCVTGTVVSLTPSQAVLEDGSTLDFDYAAICTGCSYASTALRSAETTLEGRLAELAKWRARIQAAKDILVIGGGPAGVEMTGEIVDAFAGKNVTIVHSGQQLLFRQPTNAQTQVTGVVDKWLAAHSVKVIKGCRVTSPVGVGRTEYELSNGTLMSADVALQCTGSGHPNTGFMAAEMGYALDGQGAVKVNEFLQVVGADGKVIPSLFALGDVNNVKEQKLGRTASEHAKVVAKNLQALVAGKAPTKEYKPMGMEILTLSLGRSEGTGHAGGCVLPSFMVSRIKSQDLHIDKYRKEVGV